MELQDSSLSNIVNYENLIDKSNEDIMPLVPNIEVEISKENITTEQFSTTKSLAILFLIFLTSLSSLFFVYLNLPPFDENEQQFFKLPRDIEDAKSLGNLLSKYKDSHFYKVLLGYFTTYIFLQSFAIPGSIFLSILSGFLFSFPVALFCVCFSSAIGATICYMLSNLVGRYLVWKYLPERALEWSRKVKKHEDHLLNYIIFLRVTPLLPNWFINIVSPVIDVPIKPFFFGTFLGVAPPTFLLVQAGTTLQTLSSSSDAISYTSMLLLFLFALISLIPIFLRNRLRGKFD